MKTIRQTIIWIAGFCAIILIIILFIQNGNHSTQNPAPTPFVTEPGPTPEKPVVILTSPLPLAVEYNLGDATITQSIFPEDNRFRNMPVRLNGVISVPQSGNGPFPVVVILHGNHPGCPVPEGDTVDRWPCDANLEQPNYRGFDYLAQELASRGYIAISLNVNPEYTLGFGEPVPLERLGQLLDFHLKALAEASQGGQNKFGVDLKDRVDLSKLVLVGHSQGGEGAYLWVQHEGMDQADVSQKHGFGPVQGLIMVAPSGNWAGGQPANIPVAIIQSACDNDVFTQEGQMYYEINRVSTTNSSWVPSVWLDHANHNYFNEILSDEALARPGRPDCDPVLSPEKQRAFLVDYTADFLASIFQNDERAIARLGMDLQTQSGNTLLNQSALVAALAAGENRLPVFLPLTDSELQTNLAGGSVTAKGIDTFFCEAGYYTPSVKPGSEPCMRVNLVIPGNPSLAVVSWANPGGELNFSLPKGTDLSRYKTVSLRAALDPLSPLNKPGEFQGFSIRLTDAAGNSASLSTLNDEPALRFPEGEREEDSLFEGGLFTGRVPMTSIRIPLKDFRGVDLRDIRELALVFDQTPSGSIFINDVEFVR
jgi:hypothetical protein